MEILLKKYYNQPLVVCFLGTSYSNVFPSTSSSDTTDQCYYNFDGSKLRPDTAISVEELPDVVLQPEFRHELDQQFEVSIIHYNERVFNFTAL